MVSEIIKYAAGEPLLVTRYDYSDPLRVIEYVNDVPERVIETVEENGKPVSITYTEFSETPTMVSVSKAKKKPSKRISFEYPDENTSIKRVYDKEFLVEEVHTTELDRTTKMVINSAVDSSVEEIIRKPGLYCSRYRSSSKIINFVERTFDDGKTVSEHFEKHLLMDSCIFQYIKIIYFDGKPVKVYHKSFDDGIRRTTISSKGEPDFPIWVPGYHEANTISSKEIDGYVVETYYDRPGGFIGAISANNAEVVRYVVKKDDLNIIEYSRLFNGKIIAGDITCDTFTCNIVSGADYYGVTLHLKDDVGRISESIMFLAENCEDLLSYLISKATNEKLNIENVI